VGEPQLQAAALELLLKALKVLGRRRRRREKRVEAASSGGGGRMM
jgi:hypothetical protein